MSKLANLGLALAVFCSWASTTWAQSGSDIVHDAEYYILEAQHAEEWAAEDRTLDKKLAEFRKAKANQQNLLSRAKATLAAAEKKSETLEASFQENELKLAQLEDTLRERLGTLGELFGV